MPQNQKKSLSAKTVLTDVKAGMSDSELMSKYRLSAQGLKSLLRKMIDAGLLTQAELNNGRPSSDPSAKAKLSAKAVLADLKAGMSDDALKQKFGITDTGLQTLFSKLLQAGLVTQADLDARNENEVEVVEVEVIEEIPETFPEKPPQPQAPKPRQPLRLWRCPSCQAPQSKAHDVCPQCGVIVAEFQEKLAEKEAGQEGEQKPKKRPRESRPNKGGYPPELEALAQKYGISEDDLAKLKGGESPSVIERYGIPKAEVKRALNNLGSGLGSLLGKAVEVAQRSAGQKPETGSAVHEESRHDDDPVQASGTDSSPPVKRKHPLKVIVEPHLATIVTGLIVTVIGTVLAAWYLAPSSETDARHYYDLGMRHSETGNKDEAITQLRKAVDIEPNFGEAHDQLGNLLASKGDTKGAMRHLKKALEINPNLPGGHMYLGKLLSADGKKEEAAKHFEKALLIAAEQNDVEQLKYLIGRKGVNVDARGRHRMTALMMVAQKGSFSAANDLLKHGADVNATDDEGVTPLMTAAVGGERMIVGLILDAGADVHAKDIRGQTALIIAALVNKPEALEILLKNGSYINAMNNKGETALMIAEKKNHVQIASILRRYGAQR